MLAPVDIDAVWERLQPELRQLLSPERVEHLRRECRANRATVWECPDGLVVARAFIDPEDSARKLQLWFGASEHDVGAWDRTLPALEQMARVLHCVGVRFDTVRQGWLRLAPKSGFELTNMTFEKRL